MKPEEILQAAKEAGLLHPDAKAASRIVFDFAAIIEKRTIERCAAVAGWQVDGASAAIEIRKLGEQK